MKLDSIRFPVYYLGDRKPEQEGNVTFYFYGKHHVDRDTEYQIQVIDDKNVPGESLGIRRMKLANAKQPLYKLKKAIFFLGDLIKLTKGTTWYIDSNGQAFEYRKTTKAQLIFRPISSILPIKTGGSIVEVAQVNSRFKTLLAPTGHEKWAGLLRVGNAYILYGLYEDKQEDTYRMV